MTIKEAIKELKDDIALYDSDIVRLPSSVGTPDRNLIDALEMAIEALEKQEAKKPIKQKYGRYEYKCPECLRTEYIMRVDALDTYCGFCGQKIDTNGI